MSSRSLGGTAGLLIVLSILFVGASVYSGIRLSLMPQSALSSTGLVWGYEGLHAGIQGVVVGGVNYPLGSAITSEFWWEGVPTYSDAIFDGDTSALSYPGRVEIEVGSPQQIPLGWFEAPVTIDYWVNGTGVDTGKFFHVTGEIVKYNIPVTVRSRESGQPSQWFAGESFCIEFTGVAWDNALQEQSPYSGATSTLGTAWEAPLQVVIDDYSTINNGNHYYLSPSVKGRNWDLYDEPGDAINYLGVVNPQTYEDNNYLSPDSSIDQDAYAYVVLQNFGQTDAGLYTYNPVANYVLKAYALRLGTFTYTNIDDTVWGAAGSDDNITDQFFNWVSGLTQNPFLWMLFILVGALVAAFFLMPLLLVTVPLVGGGRRRRR